MDVIELPEGLSFYLNDRANNAAVKLHGSYRSNSKHHWRIQMCR